MSAVLDLEFDEQAKEWRQADGMPILGCHNGVPFEDYKRAPGINNSGLADIHVSPELFITKRRHPTPDTRATHIGHAFHALLLEPDEFSKYYVQSKFAEFRTAEAKDWKAQQEADGKFVIRINHGDDPFWNPSEWDYIHRMRDAVMAHPIASIMVSGATATEQTLFWIDDRTRKLCKGRLDIRNDAHRMIVDIKTTKDATYGGFSRSVNEYRYHVQNAFYFDGFEKAAGERYDFCFIALEKDPPYHVAPYMLDPEWVRQGRVTYQHDMDIFKRCHDADEWPGLGWREDMGVRELAMPAYARMQRIS